MKQMEWKLMKWRLLTSILMRTEFFNYLLFFSNRVTSPDNANENFPRSLNRSPLREYNKRRDGRARSHDIELDQNSNIQHLEQFNLGNRLDFLNNFLDSVKRKRGRPKKKVDLASPQVGNQHADRETIDESSRNDLDLPQVVDHNSINDLMDHSGLEDGPTGGIFISF